MRSMKRKFRMGALGALVAVSASACAIPVGNPLGIPLVSGCTIYLFEPAQGTITIPLGDTIGIGCNIGLF